VKTVRSKTVKLLSLGSIASLLVSAIGPFGLAYILLTRHGDSILYRDSIYTFLHFQYNGFFTLAVFAIIFNFLEKKGMEINRKLKTFAAFLTVAVIPSLFLSLLWHGSQLYYALGIVGCVLLLVALFYFVTGFNRINRKEIFSSRMATILLIFSMASFVIKTILNAGTIIPSLSNAVYGDRPVIIGFLHLVFLAFVSFFILSQMTGEGVFNANNRLARTPLIVFMAGVILNEIFLMVQGLGILLMTNSEIYNWLLWIAAIVLLCGGVLLAVAGSRSSKN
jgi:hypothetical protein